MKRSTFVAVSAAAPAFAVAAFAEPQIAVAGTSPTDPAFYTCGFGPIPIPYCLKPDKSAFQSANNITVDQLLGSPSNPAGGATTNVTITPQYFKPAVADDPGCGDRRLGPGISKQYANLRVTCEQALSLPLLKETELLSWSTVWNFVQFKKDSHGDPVLAQPLRMMTDPGNAGSSLDTFTNMPLPNGEGNMRLNFVTGVNPNDAAMTLGRIFDVFPFLTGPNSPLSTLFGVPASTLGLVAQYENAIMAAVQSFGPSTRFVQILRGDPTTMVTHAQAPHAGTHGVLQLPPGTTTVAFVADNGPFQAWLEAGHAFGVDPLDGVTPIALDSSGKKAADQTPLDPFTIVVMDFKVAAAS